MSEKLIWHVASQVTELNKIVNDHRDALVLARSCFDKPEKMRELLLQLSGDIKDKKQVGILVFFNLLAYWFPHLLWGLGMEFDRSAE